MPNTKTPAAPRNTEEQFVGWLLTELERRRDGCARSAEAARQMEIPSWIQSWHSKEEAYREALDLINATKPSNAHALAEERSDDSQQRVVGSSELKGGEA